jgi:hypothetical protein
VAESSAGPADGVAVGLGLGPETPFTGAAFAVVVVAVPDAP